MNPDASKPAPSGVATKTVKLTRDCEVLGQPRSAGDTITLKRFLANGLKNQGKAIEVKPEPEKTVKNDAEKPKKPRPKTAPPKSV